MPLYMLDTDICVFVMRGPSAGLRRKLLATPIDQQCISSVTLAELQFGVVMSSQPQKNQVALDDFVRHLAVIALTEDVATAYADVRSHLQRQGQMIGANDLFIAAHARTLGAVLVTNNGREFERVPGLTVENWHEAH